jgi:hypothetical protein
MHEERSAESEFAALETEFRAYLDRLKAEWLSQNRVQSRDVYEVMHPQERAEVHSRIALWSQYITPLAEAWWREHGYGIIWPDDDSKPMQVYKLDAA